MEYVKLEEICTIVSGGTPSRSKSDYWNNGNIPWIKIKDMKSKYIDSAEEFITEEGLNNSSTKMLKSDTILYSIFATLGEVGILKIDACTNQAIAGLSLKEDSNILKEYLYYYLKSKKKDVNNLGRGVAQNNLNLSLLRKFRIPVIPLHQQKKIIEVLDNVSSTINNYERELALLDELVKARFVEMFGDPIENTYSFPILKLGELSELITKGASPSWQGYSYTEDSTQTLFVTSENVREGYMDFSSIKYVEDAFNEKQKRSMIQKGDYLINIVGASIGRAAQFNMDCKANMNQAAALVRIKDNTISDNYLLYYLNSDKAQMMYNSMKSDTGRANLSLQDIANLEILVPDLTLQVKFASFVEEIDKSRSRIQKSLEASQELFDSLMQEYFG